MDAEGALALGEHTLGVRGVSGISGFVLGPTIEAMCIAVWHISVVTRSGSTP